MNVGAETNRGLCFLKYSSNSLVKALGQKLLDMEEEEGGSSGDDANDDYGDDDRGQVTALPLPLLLVLGPGLRVLGGVHLLALRAGLLILSLVSVVIINTRALNRGHSGRGCDRGELRDDA